MAISYVAARGTATGAASSSTLAISPTGTISAGNFLVVGVGVQAGVVSSISDTQGNTYTVDDTYSADNRSTGICSSNITTQLTTGDTITITFTSSRQNRKVILGEFSGIATSSPLDQHTNTAGGSSTSPNSGNVSTTQADELLIGLCTFNSGGSAYAPGSTGGGSFTYTEVGEVTEGQITELEYTIVNSTGSYSANGTLTSSALWTQAIATYKAAAGASALSVNKSDSITVTENRKVESNLGVVVTNSIQRLNGVKVV